MTIDTSKLGWLAAGILGGLMAMGALTGFQGNTAPKFATVDIERVFDQSKLRETNQKTLNDARSARMAAFNFIAQNPAMNNADARKYADLAVKQMPTAAETAELARLKTVAEEATRKNRELQTKNPLTDAEKATLADYGAQSQGKQALLGGIETDYQSSLQELNADLREKTLDRVNEVVRTLASKQGFTIVFNTSSAPYAASDLTADALKALK